MIESLHLFIEKGYEETTLADISERSGISIGAIYKRFKDKQSILLACLESYRQTRFAEVDALCAPERWAGRSAADIVRFHIEIMFGSFRNNSGFHRLIERQRIRNPLIYDMLIDWNENIVRAIYVLLEPHAALIGHKELNTSIRYVHNIIRSSLIWAVLPNFDSEYKALRIEDDEYKRQAEHMALSYFGLR